ncbi:MULTISPECIES: hypothetical protein [Microbacterium]|uniref:hypothetical protein n=1 Tax=Microbacterium TaxID=33882 RepID=UPI00217E2E1A|nr:MULTISPECIES: hypothetical protein [Microbacterium]UWF77650.1 hypothetical protein JSY13_00735 [Microbacterium neungamense]WCM55819.1 hypothetical protein JRG78_00745 [Microbacterium sp. EF45047]
MTLPAPRPRRYSRRRRRRLTFTVIGAVALAGAAVAAFALMPALRGEQSPASGERTAAGAPTPTPTRRTTSWTRSSTGGCTFRRGP